MRAASIVAYLPKYGTLRLVVTKNRHGNIEVLVTYDLDCDLTTIVCRKRSRWSIETLFKDIKLLGGLAACQCRVDQALVHHVAFSNSQNRKGRSSRRKSKDIENGQTGEAEYPGVITNTGNGMGVEPEQAAEPKSARSKRYRTKQSGGGSSGIQIKTVEHKL